MLCLGAQVDLCGCATTTAQPVCRHNEGGSPLADPGKLPRTIGEASLFRFEGVSRHYTDGDGVLRRSGGPLNTVQHRQQGQPPERQHVGQLRPVHLGGHSAEAAARG